MSGGQRLLFLLCAVLFSLIVLPLTCNGLSGRHVRIMSGTKGRPPSVVHVFTGTEALRVGSAGAIFIAGNVCIIIGVVMLIRRPWVPRPRAFLTAGFVLYSLAVLIAFPVWRVLHSGFLAATYALLVPVLVGIGRAALGKRGILICILLGFGLSALAGGAARLNGIMMGAFSSLVLGLLLATLLNQKFREQGGVAR